MGRLAAAGWRASTAGLRTLRASPPWGRATIPPTDETPDRPAGLSHARHVPRVPLAEPGRYSCRTVPAGSALKAARLRPCSRIAAITMNRRRSSAGNRGKAIDAASGALLAPLALAPLAPWPWAASTRPLRG